LHDLIDAVKGIEITWMRLPAGNPLAGQTLAEADVRARTGASVIAIMRDRELMANPKSLTALAAGDRIALIGDRDQIASAGLLLAEPEAPALPAVPAPPAAPVA
jgi:CPA2 family monovalent cation:H+ antiporter-2